PAESDWRAGHAHALSEAKPGPTAPGAHADAPHAYSGLGGQTDSTRTMERRVLLGARALSVVAAAAALFPTAAVSVAQSSVRSFGIAVFDSALSEATDFVEIAAAQHHVIARRADGSVVAWGDNHSGECNVPALPPGLTYVEVAAGYEHTLA